MVPVGLLHLRSQRQVTLPQIFTHYQGSAFGTRVVACACKSDLQGFRCVVLGILYPVLCASNGEVNDAGL